MDSGDRSDNRLTASDGRFGGIRSQSFSNLLHGFFGIKPVPTSTGDIPSLEPSKASETGMIATTPSSDDSWIHSHFPNGKQERIEDGSLRRNATLSELGKFEDIRSAKPSTASSMTDVSGVDNEALSRAEMSGGPLLEESAAESLSSAIGNISVFEKPKAFASKHVDHPHYPRTILSSFLAYDLRRDALEPIQDVAGSDQAGSLDCLGGKKRTTSISSSNPDLLVRSDLPLVTTPKEKLLIESKYTLKDFLWSFNHEKINVSRKEMNLIASIDQ